MQDARIKSLESHLAFAQADIQLLLKRICALEKGDVYTPKTQ